MYPSVKVALVGNSTRRSCLFLALVSLSALRNSFYSVFPGKNKAVNQKHNNRPELYTMQMTLKIAKKYQENVSFQVANIYPK